MIGHALLSTNLNTLQTHLPWWSCDIVLASSARGLGFKSQQRWGNFLLFKNYFCKLPIANKFQLGKMSNIFFSDLARRLKVYLFKQKYFSINKSLIDISGPLFLRRVKFHLFYYYFRYIHIFACHFNTIKFKGFINSGQFFFCFLNSQNLRTQDSIGLNHRL